MQLPLPRYQTLQDKEVSEPIQSRTTTLRTTELSRFSLAPISLLQAIWQRIFRLAPPFLQILPIFDRFCSAAGKVAMDYPILVWLLF